MLKHNAAFHKLQNTKAIRDVSFVGAFSVLWDESSVASLLDMVISMWITTITVVSCIRACSHT